MMNNTMGTATIGYEYKLILLYSYFLAQYNVTVTGKNELVTSTEYCLYKVLSLYILANFFQCISLQSNQLSRNTS